MSSLVVLLPAQPPTAATTFDYALTQDGIAILRHGSAPAGALPPPSGAGAEVVAVIPASRMSWHRVGLPKGTNAASPRLRAVLAGLLEDNLLDEPDALHFALQPDDATGAAWVAVCDRTWLHAALQVLDTAQRGATRIVAEFSPRTEHLLYAVGNGERGALVSAGPQGVAVLPLSAQGCTLAAPAPATVCVATPAVAAMAEQLLARPVRIEQTPQLLLDAARSGWDLAQFEFARSGRDRLAKRLAHAWTQWRSAPAWRPARWAVAILLGIHLAGLNAWAWRERTALQAQREAIARTLTQTFPQVQFVVDAPVQMHKELAALRQATGSASGDDLESLLDALAAGTAGRGATAIEFGNGELRVRGVAADAAEANAVATPLGTRGYSVAMQGDWLVVTRRTPP